MCAEEPAPVSSPSPDICPPDIHISGKTPHYTPGVWGWGGCWLQGYSPQVFLKAPNISVFFFKFLQLLYDTTITNTANNASP